MILRTIIVVVLVVLVGYGVKEAWPLLAGPQLSLVISSSPPSSAQNTGSVDSGFISISGLAVHTTGVTLDGGPIVTDQQGHFATTLTLPRGGAILTVTATDRFGRSVTERRTVFVP